MAVTTLTAAGLPGRLGRFTAKSAAAGAPRADLTELSAQAVPGRAHAFSVKTPAGAGPSHAGEFTALSVLAVPGGIRVFAPKVESEPAVNEGGRSPYHRNSYTIRRGDDLSVYRDDEEMMEILSILAMTGYLNG